MANDPEHKVLACVDLSSYADSVADHAAWAALRMGAPLEFLHVIDRHPQLGAGQDHSGAIGLGAQELLLRQLSDEDAARSRNARETGRVFLNRLRERALAAGLDAVDMRQRHGDIEDTLPEHQAGVGLFVLGRRGASATATQRDLGRRLEWVVRSVQKPVVARAVKTQGFDLLVMGAYSHSGWRSLLLGSKTAELLRASTLPTLLLR